MKKIAETTSSVDATSVECPTCGAWVGWACEGEDYGCHADGYHPARERAAATPREIDLRDSLSLTDR